MAGTLADGHCYFAGDQPAAWRSTLCENWGAHLVTITSAEEQAIAASILPGADRWIGLYRPEDTAKVESSYTWVTAEPLSFTQWHVYGTRAREPKYTGQCARLRTEDGWGDADCARAYEYLCERE